MILTKIVEIVEYHWFIDLRNGNVFLIKSQAFKVKPFYK